MSINDFSRVAGQQPQIQNAVVGKTEGGRITLSEPLNPPGKWTRFKAALGDLPLLGNIGSLRQARETVAAYPVKLEHYQASNRQILQGFVQDLQSRFGENVANMAMRNLTPADGAPLSQRTLVSVLENAERGERAQKAFNNMTATRFLDSPLQGGNRLPGETDMNGVFLDMGLDLQGKGDWKEAVGKDGADFITKLVMKRCAELPGFGKAPVSNDAIAGFAREALDLFQEIGDAPGITSQKRDDILSRSLQKPTAANLVATAREFAIVDRLETLLNRKDGESLLSRVAADVMGKADMEVPGDGVMKSISHNILEKLSYASGSLPDELGCDTDVSSIMEALEDRLEGILEQAFGEHARAMTEIETATNISDSGKDVLRSVAETRRLDPVQIAAYRDIGGALGNTAGALADYLRGGAPDRLAGMLELALQSFEDNVESMKMHGDRMWEAGSLSSGDMTNQLMQEFSAFAVSDLSKQQATDLLEMLSGGRMKALMQGMMLSGDMRMAGSYPIMLSTLASAIAERAGQSPTEAVETSRALTGGEPGRLRDLEPDLARLVMTANPEEIDSRGVLMGSRNGTLIASDFTPDSVAAQHGDLILGYIQDAPLDDGTGLPEVTLKDMGRTTFIMDGIRIGSSGSAKEGVLQNFRAVLQDVDAPVAQAIGRCMNQLGINAFVLQANNMAYGQDTIVAAGEGASTQHEAIHQGDGSWLVRSTFTQTPAIVSTLQQDHMIESDGVAVYSVTYRITPGAPGENPAIAIEDSSVTFGF